MEFKLPLEIKRRLLYEILKIGNPFNLTDDYNIVDFLSEFLDLKNLPSEDNRFLSAYDDAYQHLVNNDDWDYEYIFEKRFNIIENNDIYKSFLEITINNSVEKNRSLLISLIQKNLRDYNYDLVQRYGVDTKVFYIIEPYNSNFNDLNFPQNDIPFYVVGWKENVDAEYPFFRLMSDNWDDFGYKTFYHLGFFNSADENYSLGTIRIMKRGESTTILEDKFYTLSKEYCSLFGLEKHYFVLKDIFPDRYISILASLNDAGYFPAICESFENEEGFRNSLCRDTNESEKIIRTIRHKLNYGDEISNFFDFEFLFTPAYSGDSVSFNFDFNTNKLIPKRLYCVIGKNGVGKTLMLRDLLEKLSEKNFERIFPRIPLFGKIIVVSYSYFDYFQDLKSSLDFNFLFCGLINPENNEPLSGKDIIVKIISSIDKIEKKEIEKKYFWICNSFLDSKIINDIFDIYAKRRLHENFTIADIDNVSIKKQNINAIVDKMSSGQRALFFIVTEIIANIRYNSFIIFDEPETHLHPNAITEFMNVIIELLDEFDSYGLIATHSPLIVREVFSDSIFVFEKDDDIPMVRKLEFETFGENLSAITSEIFGNKDTSKYYVRAIEELVNSGRSYEQIEMDIKGEVPLNLNLEILIKSLIKNRDEELA